MRNPLQSSTMSKDAGWLLLFRLAQAQTNYLHMTGLYDMSGREVGDNCKLQAEPGFCRSIVFRLFSEAPETCSGAVALESRLTPRPCTNVRPTWKSETPCRVPFCRKIGVELALSSTKQLCLLDTAAGVGVHGESSLPALDAWS